jgi:hypothetical protein
MVYATPAARQHRHRAVDALTLPIRLLVTAELKPRPQRPVHSGRPPINYKRKVNPIMGLPLWAFEDWAWNAVELGLEVTPKPGKGGLERAQRVIAAIQAQILEQYGWPDRG